MSEIEHAMATNPTGHEFTDRYRSALLNAFGPPQRVLVRGEGARVWDADGTEYLDLLAGIAVNALGHAHPALVAAVQQQVESIIHVSNFFATPPQIELAETLLRLAQAPDGSGVFFANSGAEANEAALKLARLTGRPRVIALEDSFHGRTLGSLSLTWKKAYREPFEPLPGGVEFLPAGDIDALARTLAPGDVAAVFAEPIQGEAGVVPLGTDYLLAARRLTREHSTLLVLDEVQTGMARTGHWFAHQAIDGLQPDVVTLAKGLGGGVPIGAVIACGSTARALLQPGQHGTTFGGNPLAAAAALAVIRTIADDGLCEHAQQMGEVIERAVTALHDPRLVAVRGAGLLRGIALRDPVAAAVAAAALEEGYIVNAPNPTTIRLAPPLIIEESQLRGFIAALPGLLDAAAARGEN